MVSLFLWSCKYNLERVRSENQGDEREKKNRLLNHIGSSLLSCTISRGSPCRDNFNDPKQGHPYILRKLHASPYYNDIFYKLTLCSMFNQSLALKKKGDEYLFQFQI